MISFTIPGLVLVSEANSHQHWRLRQKRAKAQKTSAWAHTRHQIVWRRPNAVQLPATVTITRIAPRMLDSDNAVGSAKHVRDGIAEALGIDDSSPLVAWEVRQERGAPRYYSVRIEISPTPDPLTESRTQVAGNGAEGEVDPRKVPRNKSASGDCARSNNPRKAMSSTKKESSDSEQMLAPNPRTNNVLGPNAPRVTMPVFALIVRSSTRPHMVSLRSEDGEDSIRSALTQAGFQPGDKVKISLVRGAE